MKEKINITELLKDCPTGMELDCALFEGLEFDCIVDNEYLPIRCRIKHPNGGYIAYNFTKYGCWLDTTFAKCVIFPKGKTTWEGFVPPCKFKDGDIVYVKSNEQNEYIIIFKGIKNDHIHKYACFAYRHLSIDKCALCHLVDAEIMRFATEEEKQKLFDAIKANGYKWNAETKTLEKLIEPRFKVGDRVKHIPSCKSGIIVKVDDKGYYINYSESVGVYYFSFILEKDYELVPNKFDITTLKPFDKVLVRGGNSVWHIQFFEKYDKRLKYPFVCMCNSNYKQCIPYNDETKHLLNTTNDCGEYYKTWE